MKKGQLPSDAFAMTTGSFPAIDFATVSVVHVAFTPMMSYILAIVNYTMCVFTETR